MKGIFLVGLKWRGRGMKDAIIRDLRRMSQISNEGFLDSIAAALMNREATLLGGWWQEDFEILYRKPRCPKCGSGNITLALGSYVCRDCGERYENLA